MHGAQHCTTLDIQRKAAAACMQLQLHNKALMLLETVFQNGQCMQVSDIVTSVMAHSQLGNYDVALQLINTAFLLLEDAQFQEGEALQFDEFAVMELHLQRAHLMSLQNQWLEAKIELETCLKYKDLDWLLQQHEAAAEATRTPTANSVADSGFKATPTVQVVLRAAAALAYATAKCGGIFAGETLFQKTQSVAVTAYGAHGVPTLDTQHSFVRFLYDIFGATSAQMIDAQAIIIRVVEAKWLLLGAHHSSTVLSMQLMCHILSESAQPALYESALLDVLSSSVAALGWLHIDTLHVSLQLARLHHKRHEVERAELLYSVGLCLLDALSGDDAAMLSYKTQQALLQLCAAAAQADKVAVLQALMRQQESHADGETLPFLSRNFSADEPHNSRSSRVVTQLLHTCICDLKRALPGSHPAAPLVRLSEAILSRGLGQNDRARALFSSCMGDMGSSWWHHPDCSFVVISLASVMIAVGNFESSSALLTQTCAGASERDPRVSIDLMLSAADMFQRVNKMELVVQFLQQAIALQSLHLGPASSNTLSSQHLLADLHVSTGALHLAEGVMWDALESCEVALGQTHSLTIEWLEELAQLYVLLDNMPKAVLMADAAANASFIVFGESHGSTLAAFERLARLLRACGQLFRSRDIFEKCLRLRIHAHGEDAASTNVARTALVELQTLLLPLIKEQETEAAMQQICDMEVHASQSLRDDDVDGAIKTLGACFEVAKDTFGSDSTDAARAAASYGCVLLQVQEFRRAQELLQKAAVVLQRELGWWSKEGLVSVSALARACVGVGDVKTAEVLLIDCLDRCERALGLNDDFSMKIVLQLGKLYCMTDSKLHTARDLLQEYLSHTSHVHQHLNGGVFSESRDWELLDGLDNLVNVLVKLKDVQAAEHVLQKAMEIRIQLYGSSHLSTLEVASRLANFFVSTDDPQQAVPYLEHVLDARSKSLGSAAHASLCAAEELAAAHEALSQLGHAQLLLTLCLTQRRAVDGAANPDCMAGVMRLGLILQKAGKYEAALQCFLEYLDMESSDFVFYGFPAYTAAESAGFCMMKMGHWERARIMFKACVQALCTSTDALEGAVKQRMFFCLNSLGFVAASEGNFEEAEMHFDACLSLGSPANATGDVSDLEFADAAWNFAVMCQSSGKFPKSESLLLQCVQVLERGNNCVAKALDAKHSLALLYRSAIGNFLGT